MLGHVVGVKGHPQHVIEQDEEEARVKLLVLQHLEKVQQARVARHRTDHVLQVVRQQGKEGDFGR